MKMKIFEEFFSIGTGLSKSKLNSDESNSIPSTVLV